MKILSLLFITLLLLSGCSAKEFNDGVESITSDVTNAFDAGKDKSAD